MSDSSSVPPIVLWGGRYHKPFWNVMTGCWTYFGTNTEEYSSYLREFKRRNPWA
jgi:hypothetical protein